MRNSVVIGLFVVALSACTASDDAPTEELGSSTAEVRLPAAGQAQPSCVSGMPLWCSILSDGMSDADHTSIHTYRRACSALLNWGRSAADIEIRNTATSWPAKILRVTQSTALGGGIASVRWQAQAGSETGHEFVASGGHGSAMGWNVVSEANGECYNPTLGGAKRDEFHNLDGSYVPYYNGSEPVWGCATTNPWSYVRAQAHGPSDTAYYPDEGTVGLETSFTYNSRLAFWVPQGWTGVRPGGNCTANYPVGDGRTYNLSPFWLAETTKVGSLHNSGGTLLQDFPFLQSDATFTTQEVPPAGDNAHMDGRYVTYLLRAYKKVYRVVPNQADQLLLTTDANGNAVLAQGATGCSPFGGGYGCTSPNSQPLMWTTNDNAYAIGVYTTRGTTARGSLNQPYYWAEHSIFEGVGTRTLQITATMNSAFASGGRVDQRVFAVVGSRAQVSTTLGLLAQNCATRTACYLQ